jgi:hypothetical protein
MTAGLLGAVAAGGITAAVLIPWMHSQQAQLYRYYTTEQADRLIESFNAKLRTQLGLTEADVQGIDLQTRRLEAQPWIGLGSAGLTFTF